MSPGLPFRLPMCLMILFLRSSPPSTPFVRGASRMLSATGRERENRRGSDSSFSKLGAWTEPGSPKVLLKRKKNENGRKYRAGRAKEEVRGEQLGLGDFRRKSWTSQTSGRRSGKLPRDAKVSVRTPKRL